MNPKIIFRLLVFFGTIALIIALIVWAAHSSMKRMNELHEQLSAKQWKSFQIADHLQQSILGLNNLMLRYAAYRDDADWANFDNGSKELGRWLTEQQPLLSSAKEKPFIEKIISAYKDYLAAATALHTRIFTIRQSITRVVEFTDLENRSRIILGLGIQLSEAHQQSIDVLQEQNTRTLGFLRLELFGSLAIFIIAGICVAWVVYREMIAPLQVQLVESREIVERQEKLASLGMLAAGVAHEIRNPLTAIKAWLYLQQKHLKPSTPEFADAEIIGGEINRLERIVKDFLQFARPSDPQLAVMPAEQPLREVQTLLQPELEKSEIKLLLEESGATHQIQVDPQQIKQVLINLVRNAADSIGKNGTVTLRPRLDEMRINDREMDVVILEVSDTGKGLSEEAQERLFDPFFTTKDSGTGLGLPIAARIVEKHGGALQYQNDPGRGATFGIILPLHKQ